MLIHVANWLSDSGIVFSVNLAISNSTKAFMPVQVVEDVSVDVPERLI